MPNSHDDQENETTYYRYCRAINGDLVPLNTARRNGTVVPLFEPSALEYEASATTKPEPAIAKARQSDSRYFVNLNSVERRTWWQILGAIPVGAIARNEGVSRQAIYSRILGRGGYGGMIAKNYWVLIWCIARGLYPPKRRRSGKGS